MSILGYENKDRHFCSIMVECTKFKHYFLNESTLAGRHLSMRDRSGVVSFVLIKIYNI